MDPYVEKFSSLNLHDRNIEPKIDLKFNNSDPGYGRIVSKNSPQNSYPAYSSMLVHNNVINETNTGIKNTCNSSSGSNTGSLVAVRGNEDKNKLGAYARAASYFENGHRKDDSKILSYHKTQRSISPASITMRESSYSSAGSAPGAQVDYKLKNCPVYENIDYYNTRNMGQIPSSYHPVVGMHSRSGSQDSKNSSPRTSVAGTDSTFIYDSLYRRAQPQVPAGIRYHPSHVKDHTYYEPPPVYENVQTVLKSYNHEPAKPGPQVPIAGEHKQIVAPGNAELGFIASSFAADCNKSLTSNNIGGPTAVQHQVITSPQQRSSVAQASTADAFVQQPYYGFSGPPKSSLTAACSQHISRTNFNQNANQNSIHLSEISSRTNSSYPKVEREMTMAVSPSPDNFNYNNDVGSLSTNKLLPYNVTPPRPMVSNKLRL